MSVTKLDLTRDKPVRIVVILLKQALALAESGELRDIAMTGTLDNGDSFTSFHTLNNVATIGQLELLKLRVLQNIPQDHIQIEEDET